MSLEDSENQNSELVVNTSEADTRMELLISICIL